MNADTMYQDQQAKRPGVGECQSVGRFEPFLSHFTRASVPVTH